MNGFHNNKWPTILLWVSLLLLLTGSAGAQSSPEVTEVAIGYMEVPNPLTVAKELGWIEKELNQPVKWVKFDSGSHVLDAVAKKQVDLMHIGSTPCAVGIANGMDLEVIWVTAVISDGEALVAHPNSGIKKLSDLIGKRVATPFGSTSHYALKVALNLEGIDESRVTILSLDPEQLHSAWKEGKIDAGYVWEPVLTRLHESDGITLMTSKDLALRGFPTADLFVARKAFAVNHPKIVSKVVNSLHRATELCRSDIEHASAAVAQGLRICASKALQQMQGMIFLTVEEQKTGRYIGKLQLEFGLYTLLKDAADFMKEQGAIEYSPPWPAFRRAINSGHIEEIYRKIKRPKY